jgi:RNA polymerase sigma-70 factor (ECF subfamily)
VRNALLNQIRDSSREAELTNDEPWFQTASHDRAAELDLRCAMGALPDEQREVVMMHIWGGLTFEEVAAALEISANTAASRYRYALAALKKTLSPAALRNSL